MDKRKNGKGKGEAGSWGDGVMWFVVLNRMIRLGITGKKNDVVGNSQVR